MHMHMRMRMRMHAHVHVHVPVSVPGHVHVHVARGQRHAACDTPHAKRSKWHANHGTRLTARG